MDRVTAENRLSVLVAVPPVCAALAWIATLALAGVTGTHPIWSLTARNLAEAAAFRDGGAVVRFVEAGHDINQPGEVRGGVVRSETTMLTPVEAAAAARQREMLQVLLDLGASPDAIVWQRAYCISDADSVRELLISNRPPGAVDDCAEH
jgi:hypothetical protein